MEPSAKASATNSRQCFCTVGRWLIARSIASERLSTSDCLMLPSATTRPARTCSSAYLVRPLNAFCSTLVAMAAQTDWIRSVSTSSSRRCGSTVLAKISGSCGGHRMSFASESAQSPELTSEPASELSFCRIWRRLSFETWRARTVKRYQPNSTAIRHAEMYLFYLS